MKRNEPEKPQETIMKRKPSEEKRKKGESDAVGLLCLAAAFLLPLFMIFILIRLLLTHGAPVWYLVLHGVLSAMAVFQAVFFLRLGLAHAVRHYMNGRRRERSEE